LISMQPVTFNVAHNLHSNVPDRNVAMHAGLGLGPRGRPSTRYTRLNTTM
jgi:hypothetical protein